MEAGHARRLLEQTRRAQAEHARAAALDERTRIARELHDVLAHSLGALGVQLELTDALLSEKGDVAAGLDRVRRARRLAADGLAEARHAVAALREDVPPLTEALARLAAAHGDDHAGEVSFQVGGTPRSLPPAITVCLLRTTREALTNAARHAPATPVTVRLDYRPDAVRLEVRNGPGAAGSGRAARPGGIRSGGHAGAARSRGRPAGRKRGRGRVHRGGGRMAGRRGGAGVSGDPVIRVLVADDQEIVREGLVALLGLVDDIEVVGAAGDGEGVLRLLAEAPADVVLMDLRMPVLDGVEATRRIVRDHPEVAVLVLTTYADDESIAAALGAGARGYLTKDAGRAEIAAALRATASGQSTFDSEVSRRLVRAMLRPYPTGGRADRWSNPDRLTPREVEVLTLIAQGMDNARIAASLFIGETTVKTHVNNVFAKIGARNRSDATRYACRHGLAGEDRAP